MKNLSEWKTIVDKLSLEHSHQKAKLQEEQATLIQLKQDLLDHQRAKDIIQVVAQQSQEVAHGRIASVVSSCLKGVFGEEAYKFEIEFLKKRGRTEARLYFTRNGKELDPLGSSGGGVIDVTSLALRVASLILAKPPLRRLLVLDEPLKHLSENYRGKAKELLEKISQEMQIQIIMVTHSEELKTGKIIEI